MNKIESSVEEWLNKKDISTQKTYLIGITYFYDYYLEKHNITEPFQDLVDRREECSKLPLLEQRNVIEDELFYFIKWLNNKPTKRDPSKTISANSIRTFVAAIQSFFKSKKVIVSFGDIDNLPASNLREENDNKHQWTTDDVRAFVEAGESHRDRALILCAFQSGLAVAELCSLNYDHVRWELERGIQPLMIKMVRGKEDMPFRTFFGADATTALKEYLKPRLSTIKPEDPLFDIERDHGTDRITTYAIEARFSKIAQKLDFLRQKNGAYNAARPHSLRSAFKTLLTGTISDDLVKYLMGHSLGVERHYLKKSDSDLRNDYVKLIEPKLSVYTTSEKVKAGFVPGSPITELTETNIKLKNELAQLRADIPKMIEFTLDGALGRISELTLRIEKMEKDQMDDVELSEHSESDLRWKLYDELHPPRNMP